MSVLVVVAVPARAKAEPLGNRELAGALRRRPYNFPDNWEVNPAVVAGANATGTPELRDRLVPVLTTAYDRCAAGYDRLYAAVCIDDGAMSSDRARACSTLPAAAEKEWRLRRQRQENWTIRIVLTASYATLVTLTYVDRNEEDSRRTAGLAGFVPGMPVGGTLVGGVGGTALCHHPCDSIERNQDRVLIPTAVAALAGGIAGGAIGSLLAERASPGARAPVVAGGLGLLYFPVVALTFR